MKTILITNRLFTGLTLGLALTAGCGVKKAPDTYYKHPMQFGDEPSPTPTIASGAVPHPEATPSEPKHE